MIKIASWNVNSLRVRMDAVLSWLKETEVDVLLMQETKVVDELFPSQRFEDLGFYVSFKGQKTYNGVAISSRLPMKEILVELPDGLDAERRIQAVKIEDILVVNLYVPNGAAIGTDKYAYKLKWLSHVTTFLNHQLQEHSNLLVGGDFNIAPNDKDVHDPKAWEGSVLVSPSERAAFESMISLGLTDSFRHCHPDSTEYSWWDYRAAAFRRNLGLRIDHILLSPALISRCLESAIDTAPRRAQRPSDHAPVWVKLKIL